MKPSEKYAAIKKALEGICRAQKLPFRWRGDGMGSVGYPMLEGHLTGYKAIGRDNVVLEEVDGSDLMARYTVGRRAFVFSVRAMVECASGPETAGALLDNLRLAMSSDEIVDRQVAADFAVVDEGTISELDPPKGSTVAQAILDLGCETVVEGDECSVQTFDKIMASSEFEGPDGEQSAANFEREIEA